MKLVIEIVILVILIGILVFVCCVYRKNEDRVKGLADILAVALLFLCALGVLLVSVIWFVPKDKQTIKQELVITATPDTTGFKCEEFSFYTDSLINVIYRHEDLLERKYASVLEEKEYTMKVQSVLGVLISIIVAVVGFFGYKNIKSIEKKAINLAEEKVKKEVSDYLDKNLVAKLRGVLKSNFAEYMDEKVSNKIASQIKGEVSKRIIEETESKIQDDIVGFFTIRKGDTNTTESGSSNPFEKES